MKVRRFICIVISVMLIPVLLIACGSGGESYPTRNINGYIAWAAGGATDSVVRTITPIVESQLGQSLVLSNRPGGVGLIATQYVQSQSPNGYSILFNAESMTLYKVLGLGDLDHSSFIPVAILARNVAVLVVPADSPYQTFQDFIDDCIARQGRVNVGATGVGALTFNTFSLITMVDGVEFNLVNFDGDGTMIPAVIGGQMDISVLGQSLAVQYVQSGHLRALGVFNDERLSVLPDVPTMNELNPDYGDIQLDKWGPFYAAYVREDTDPEIVRILSDAFANAVNDESFIEFAEMLGLDRLGLTGQEAIDFLNHWQAMTAWALYEANATEGVSPADLGIERP